MARRCAPSGCVDLESQGLISWRRLLPLPALQPHTLLPVSLIPVPHLVPSGGVGMEGFGFATFGGFIGKVSANSAPRPQTHTHSLSQQLPGAALHHSGFLSCLGLGTPVPQGPGFCILDASSPSVGPVPLHPLLPSAGRGLVLGQWYVLKQQFSYSAGHTLGNHGMCPYLRQGFESVWFIWKEIPNKEGE